MHTKRILALGVAVVLAITAGFADLTSETLSDTWTRGEASSNRTGAAFLTGSQVLLTNCMAMLSATTPQDLTGLGGYVTYGSTAITNTPQTAQIIMDVATNGTFSCAAFSIPTFSQLGGTAGYPVSFALQLTLTNGLGGSYTYRGVKNASAIRSLGGN
jgi:hypothetical protein